MKSFYLLLALCLVMAFVAKDADAASLAVASKEDAELEKRIWPALIGLAARGAYHWWRNRQVRILSLSFFLSLIIINM